MSEFIQVLNRSIHLAIEEVNRSIFVNHVECVRCTVCSYSDYDSAIAYGNCDQRLNVCQRGGRKRPSIADPTLDSPQTVSKILWIPAWRGKRCQEPNWGFRRFRLGAGTCVGGHEDAASSPSHSVLLRIPPKFPLRTDSLVPLTIANA